jgi:hypothetical protein
MLRIPLTAWVDGFPPLTRRPTVLDGVITAGLSIVGIAVTSEILLDLRRARQSSWWPVVEADLLDSWVDPQRGAGSNDSRNRSDPTTLEAMFVK